MSEKSQILFYNGNIWQWNDQQEEAPRAKWMIINEETGLIEQIGVNQPSKDQMKKITKQINLNGKFVLPGLQDAHIHLHLTGEVFYYVQLQGCKSIQEMQQRINQHVEKFPELPWIVGFGWDQDALSSNGIYPTRFDLDQCTTNKPIFVWRACWHVAVANTKALEISNLDLYQQEWNIQQGVVDVANGSITGLLRESATELVQKHIHHASADLRMKYLLLGLQQCLQYGLTGVHTNDHNCFQLYETIQKNDQLPIRVFLTPDHSEIGNESIPKAGTVSGLISCHRVKIFGDGSLGAETAALRKPYRDTTNKGVLFFTSEEMKEKISKAIKHGYRLEIHAIGDQATEQIIDAVEELELDPNQRLIITHCQVLGKDLMIRMAKNGIIANIQPSFTLTDGAWARKRLDDDVQQYSYCWKSMLNAGIICAGGSDAPIETCNPLRGIYDAIHRSLPETPEEEIYLPHEKVTFTEALRMYTLNAAYASNAENQLGNLAPGYVADFIVLNQDVSKNEASLLTEKPLEVWVNGIQRLKEENQDILNSINASNSLLPGKNGKIRICKCCRLY